MHTPNNLSGPLYQSSLHGIVQFCKMRAVTADPYNEIFVFCRIFFCLSQSLCIYRSVSQSGLKLMT